MDWNINLVAIHLPPEVWATSRGDRTNRGAWVPDTLLTSDQPYPPSQIVTVEIILRVVGVKEWSQILWVCLLSVLGWD
jgi:hypothetical protein